MQNTTRSSVAACLPCLEQCANECVRMTVTRIADAADCNAAIVAVQKGTASFAPRFGSLGAADRVVLLACRFTFHEPAFSKSARCRLVSLRLERVFAAERVKQRCDVLRLLKRRVDK